MTNDLRAKVRARIVELVPDCKRRICGRCRREPLNCHCHYQAAFTTETNITLIDILVAVKKMGRNAVAIASDGYMLVEGFDWDAAQDVNLTVPWDAPENDEFVRWIAPLLGVKDEQGN